MAPKLKMHTKQFASGHRLVNGDLNQRNLTFEVELHNITIFINFLKIQTIRCKNLWEFSINVFSGTPSPP